MQAELADFQKKLERKRKKKQGKAPQLIIAAPEAEEKKVQPDYDNEIIEEVEQPYQRNLNPSNDLIDLEAASL